MVLYFVVSPCPALVLCVIVCFFLPVHGAVHRGFCNRPRPWSCGSVPLLGGRFSFEHASVDGVNLSPQSHWLHLWNMTSSLFLRHTIVLTLNVTISTPGRFRRSHLLVCCFFYPCSESTPWFCTSRRRLVLDRRGNQAIGAEPSLVFPVVKMFPVDRRCCARCIAVCL